MGAPLPEPATATRTFLDLPAPKGLPLLGNVFQLDSMRFHVTLENWIRELGPMYRFKGGPRNLMVLSDPAIIGTLLRDRPDTFRRTYRSARAFAVIAHGVSVTPLMRRYEDKKAAGQNAKRRSNDCVLSGQG